MANTARGVAANLPSLSQSLSAKAMQCTTKSISPKSLPTRSKHAAMSASLATSIGCSHGLATPMPSTSLRVRRSIFSPGMWVKMHSAPSRRRLCEIAVAMLVSWRTPVTSPRLPVMNPIACLLRGWEG